MASNIYITPRTSLVLIKSLAQQTNIYMSTYNVPDFQINIRDATGSPQLLTNPINICTINGARFTNNTTHYAINQPFGFVNLSLRTSSLWQVLHTSGQTPETSAANVNTTNFSTFNFGTASTAAKYVSSMTVENIETPNTIQLTGPFVIGNLSSPGFIQMQSTLNVYGDTSFEKSVFISGATLFKSSLALTELIPLSSIFRTYGNLSTTGSVSVGGTVSVLSTLQTNSTLQVDTLDVQLSSINEPVVHTRYLQVGGLLSSLGNVDVESGIIVSKDLTVTQTISSLDLSLWSSLTVFGRVIGLSSLSTNDQNAISRFESSLTLQSSLGIQTNVTTLSSAFVTEFVSSGFFETNLLSSGTSFSTAGDFSILSTLTVKGNLSTNLLRILNTLSVGNDFVTLQNLSTTENASLMDTLVSQSAWFNSIVGTTGGIQGLIQVKNSTIVDELQIESDVNIRDLLEVRSAADFGMNMGIGGDVRVINDMTVFGVTSINNYNVGSYGLNTLYITTSSPYVALRVSTFDTPLLSSQQAKFVNNSQSGSLSLLINSSIQGDTLYANSTQISKLSTLSIYTNSLLPDYPSISMNSDPKFLISLRSVFFEGLSTISLQSDSIIGDEIRGSFIGDGTNLTNIALYFSTISANTVFASSINTSLFSCARINLGSGNIDGAIQKVEVSTNLYVDRYALFQSLVTNPCLFISSGGANLQDEFLIPLNFFGGGFGKLETIDSSSLLINDTLYMNAQTRRYGVMTSTPQYDFDISGSLYLSGQLYLSTFSPATLSTTRPVVSFSTIYYSSIYIQESLVLPPAFANFAFGSTFAITLVPNSFQEQTTPFLIASRAYPYNPLITQGAFFPGIFTNSNYSTLDIATTVFINNSNKNVGIGVFGFDPVTLGGTPSNFPDFDLFTTYSTRADELRISSASIFTKLLISSFTTPTLGILPPEVSTLNTFLTNNLSSLVLDQFVELFKDTTLAGSFQIKRPIDAPLRALFSVYNDAYISSISIKNLAADTISCGFQSL